LIINPFWEIKYRQGRSDRFTESKLSYIPGPGNYRIPGFTEGVLKKNAKYLNQTLNNSNMKNSKDINENQNDCNSNDECENINKRGSRGSLSKDKIYEEKYD